MKLVAAWALPSVLSYVSCRPIIIIMIAGCIGCTVPAPPGGGGVDLPVPAPANCADTGGEWLDAEGCRCPFTKVYTMEQGCACPEDLPVFNDTLKRCEVEPPPTTTAGPPPADAPKPEDYVALERVEDILYGTSGTSPGLIADNQFVVWAGWRDPQYVFGKCGFACENSWIGMSCGELSEFGTRGAELVNYNETNLIPRFPEVNRRCKDDETFCDATNIRKNVWEPHHDEINGHISKASALRARAASCRKAVEAAGQGTYDSVKGWCEKMLAGDVPLSACPE